MKKIIFLFCFFVPVAIFASAHDGPKDFDVIPRTVNFVIFFGILFYLLKNPIKKAYNDRINSIASRLDAIQNILKESKLKKEQAIKDLEIAKNQASEFIEIAKKEAINAEIKLKENTELEIRQIKKNFEEQKDFESRKVTKTIVGEILDEIFDKNSIQLGQNELIDIVQKRAV